MPNINDLKEVGSIGAKAIEYAKTIIKPGSSLIEIANKIENFIKSNNVQLAFPVNLSINEIAAHYTPSINDKTIINGNEVIKIDLGARKGDALSDCAITIDLSNNYQNLIKASEEALNAAISKVKAGISVNEIGREVEEVAKKYNVNPIKNLGGHGIEKGSLHARIFIPNYDNGDDTKLDEGEIIAIETFLTIGKSGFVDETDYVEIYSSLGINIRSRRAETRSLYEFINNNFSTYPFATRWLINDENDEFKVKTGISELLRSNALEPYPALIEKSNGIVAQTEKTMIVEKDSCMVTTEFKLNYI